MAVKPIPEGYHSVTPYLVVPGVSKLLEFVKQAFGAELIYGPMKRPDGSIAHVSVKIGDSMLMMGEPMGDEWKAMPAVLYLYVNDADSVYKRALAASATSVMEPADQFYGDRNGGVKDSSDNLWWIATHKEDVDPEALERRAQALAKKQHGG